MVTSNEWWTPALYTEAVRTVMGSIDLDPASCAEANETVKALHYFDIEDNGLQKEWFGNVFLNPPYGKIKHNVSSLGLWITKFFEEYRQGHVAQGILLTTSDPDERWFTPLWQYTVCFTVPRVTFSRPGKKPERQSFGTAFTYVGPHEDAFIDTFNHFGIMARALNTLHHPVLRRH